jgi:hypothetical protein
MTANLEGLDKTIQLLNGMLEATETTKEKLQIADRLLRAYSLLYKHVDSGKGEKFSSFTPSTHTAGAPSLNGS